MTLIETIEGSDSNAITAHKAKHQPIKCDNFIFISISFIPTVYVQKPSVGSRE